MNGVTQNDIQKGLMTAELYAHFGAPPLLPNESRNRYLELAARTLQAVNKADVFERLYAKRLVNATVELERLTNAKPEVINAARKKAFRALLRASLDGPEIEARTEIYLQE